MSRKSGHLFSDKDMRQRKNAERVSNHSIGSTRYNGMRHALKRHPDSLGGAAARVEVEVARPEAGRLALSYVVTGPLADLHLPPAATARRAHALWEHTCFEVFIRATPGGGYYEFNFAPSTHWAAYWLTGYRSGMEAAREIGDPAIAVQSSAERYTLQAVLDLGRLSRLPRAGWRIGLSALVEDVNGRKSYWALAHPPGKPDFHHSDCFAYEFS